MNSRSGFLIDVSIKWPRLDFDPLRTRNEADAYADCRPKDWVLYEEPNIMTIHKR
jgi:hypothetical protein